MCAFCVLDSHNTRACFGPSQLKCSILHPGADIIKIIREAQPLELAADNGEVELDFDALEPATLWKLWDFTERMAGGANGRLGRGASPEDSDLSDTDSEGDLG